MVGLVQETVGGLAEVQCGLQIASALFPIRVALPPVGPWWETRHGGARSWGQAVTIRAVPAAGRQEHRQGQQQLPSHAARVAPCNQHRSCATCLCGMMVSKLHVQIQPAGYLI